MPKLAGDHVQVLVSGYELTPDSQRVAISDRYDLHDVTAFGDAVHKFIVGQRKAALEHVGYMEAAAGRSHPVLKGGELEGAFSLLLGQNSLPSVGDPVFSVATIQGKYAVLPEMNNFIPFAAAFAHKGDQGGWGVALAVPVTFTATANGSAVDHGAATSSGGAAYVHLLQAAATDRYSISVEGATNSTFTTGVVTLATFTLNAAALGSERVTIVGSIPQYTRWKATRTSGAANNTVKIAVSLIRF